MGNVCFGIDLGTTNSCISMLGQGTTVPTVIPLKNGKTIQSCVMLNADGTLTVGKEAYEHRFEKSAIYSVKRYMGTDKVIHLENGDHSMDLTPTEVSAEILKEIVKQASEYIGENIIKDVTITVPAHFNDNQRRATKSAGEMAGLNVVSIINEPTSAGLLYGLDTAKDNETILVYDLGGGTFDVSILRVTKTLREFPALGINMNGEYNKTAINIVGNEGDVKLGGDDIDEAMVEYVLEQVANTVGSTIPSIKQTLGTDEIEELKLRLEQAKKEGLETISYNYLGKDITCYVKGEAVNEVVYRPIFNRTYDLVSQALANTGIAHIDKIVLVGGSTKSEVIRSMLREKFPHIAIMNTFEPDLSVALGASISSASVLGVSKIATITDVVPMSIGVPFKDINGSFTYSKILRKDSSLPAVSSKVFGVGDYNKDLTIVILQGDTNVIDDLTPIGILNLKGGTYGNHNSVEVRFRCDLNGVLYCTVVLAGKEYKVDIQYTGNDTAHGATASKDDESQILESLDKASKMYYKTHKQRLLKGNYTNDVIDSWKPSVMLNGITEAEKIFQRITGA